MYHWIDSERATCSYGAGVEAPFPQVQEVTWHRARARAMRAACPPDTAQPRAPQGDPSPRAMACRSPSSAVAARAARYRSSLTVRPSRIFSLHQ